MKTLKDTFPDLEFGTVKECLNTLHWEYKEVEENYIDIKCDCGIAVKSGGWAGIEQAWCPGCGKGMQKTTGFLPTSATAAGILDLSEYDLSDRKVWTPKNIWGFK